MTSSPSPLWASASLAAVWGHIITYPTRMLWRFKEIMSMRTFSKQFFFENYMKVSCFYSGLHLGNENFLDMQVVSATQICNQEGRQVQIWEALAARQGQRSPLRSCREGKRANAESLRDTSSLGVLRKWKEMKKGHALWGDRDWWKDLQEGRWMVIESLHSSVNRDGCKRSK